MVSPIKNKIKSHRKGVEALLQVDSDSEGVKVLEALKKISDANDEDIIEGIEIANQTLPELMQEFEQVRLNIK